MSDQEGQQGSCCLWIGDLSPWLDENWLKRTFAFTQALVSCKVIRHKTTQASRGYGFLLFNSHEAASYVLTNLNGKPIPGTEQVFRLNWAANGRPGSTGTTDYSLFVGDLVDSVTDYMLQEFFRRFYPSVRSAKVMRAPLSGRSRNFGFCRFADEQEREKALVEMNGAEIGGRPVRVSRASAKKTQTESEASGEVGSSVTAIAGEHLRQAPVGTTLYIGNVGEGVKEDQLRSMFSLFGEILSVKCLPSRNCAFVQFLEVNAAKAAMTGLQNQVVAGLPIKISWGRQNVARQSWPGVDPSAGYTYPGGVLGGGFVHGSGTPGTLLDLMNMPSRAQGPIQNLMQPGMGLALPPSLASAIPGQWQNPLTGSISGSLPQAGHQAMPQGYDPYEAQLPPHFHMPSNPLPTQQPTYSVNPAALSSRADMEQLLHGFNLSLDRPSSQPF